MTRLIQTASRLDAWIEATEVLLDCETELNLVLSVDRPGWDGPVGRAAASAVDNFLRAEKQNPLHTVAETIFPAWEYRKRGLRGVFDTYADEEYPVIKAGWWGTYAHRLVRRTTAEGEVINPLAILIEKMKNEVTHAAPKRACYEIGVAEGEYDMPLYSSTDDENRRMSGPCLSHLSFKYYKAAVHLTAVYRSHDYRYKALGNLLGLARLQACVAKEVGAPLGALVVHSTYAWLQPGRGKRALSKLIANVRQLADSQEASL